MTADATPDGSTPDGSTSGAAGGRPTTPAMGGTRHVPIPDPVARDYLLLALRLDQHITGIVDGYVGPADLKARVDMEQLRSPARLRDEAAALRGRLSSEIDDGARRAWLAAQLIALETQAQALAGEPLPYLDHVERCFDWRPLPTPDRVFDAAAAEIDAHLPGSGPLQERLAAWDASLTIPVDRLPAILDWLVGIFRARAAESFGLPDGEQVRLSLVTDRPWSGYNWYEGGLRSRVEINTDLPVRAPDLLRVASHETYPGHHLEHALKEAGLVLEQGRLESSAMLINTPECLISEGLANLGYRFAIPPAAEVDLLAELFERAGLAGDDPTARRSTAEVAAAVRPLRDRLGAVAAKAALLRHVDGLSRAAVRDYLVTVGRQAPERAEQRMGFIEHPLWRTYVFVYSAGEALLTRWLEQVPEGERQARFARLLHEAVTPSGIAAEVAAAGG